MPVFKLSEGEAFKKTDKRIENICNNDGHHHRKGISDQRVESRVNVMEICKEDIKDDGRTSCDGIRDPAPIQHFRDFLHKPSVEVICATLNVSRFC